MTEDSYVVLLSGPLATHRQAEDAARSAGLGVIAHDPRRHSFGHDHADPTAGYMPVRAGHPDQVSAARGLAGFGWSTVAYWPEPAPAAAVEVVPAGTLERLDRLEAALTAGGLL